MQQGHWTQKAVSEHLNMSVSTLKRKLNDEGSNFRDIISTIKINIAKNKLSTTIESIASIAHNLGYSTTSNFMAAFKRKENLSPSQYREKAKNPE